MVLRKILFLYIEAIVPLSILIPIVPAAGRYRHLPDELKILSWYLFCGAVTDILTSMLAHNSVNNMPVMHIYTLAELILLMAFYKEILKGTKIHSIIPLLTAAFALLCIVNVAFFQNLFTFNTYTKSLEALIIIFLSILYFKKNLDGTVPGKGNPLMYINSGMLLYFSGSFIWFILFNKAMRNADFCLIMSVMHATLLLILYILTAIALWKYKRPELHLSDR